MPGESMPGESVAGESVAGESVAGEGVECGPFAARGERYSLSRVTSIPSTHEKPSTNAMVPRM